MKASGPGDPLPRQAGIPMSGDFLAANVMSQEDANPLISETPTAALTHRHPPRWLRRGSDRNGRGASLGGETQMERACESSETMRGPVSRTFSGKNLPSFPRRPVTPNPGAMVTGVTLCGEPRSSSEAPGLNG